jgi:RimJ/RimL family protein N-acetyltransferase
MNKVYLRALELEDLTQLVKWRNDTNVTELLGGNTFFVSKYRESEWIKSVILNDKNDIRLAICLNENNKHIGNANITAINWINRSGEFSILIGEKDMWGKGYGEEASKLTLKYAFQELNLNRIYLTVKENNVSAIKLYLKIGFVKEGILRENIYKNGVYTNMVMMSLLKSEYK